MNLVRSLLLAAVFFPMTASAVPILYTDEAAYLAALTAGGYGTIFEGFEDDGAWAVTRTPNSASQVSNQGILWTSNFSANNISTSTMGGDPHGGIWGFYSNPHGDQNAETSDAVCDVPDPIPSECFLHDGFKGTSDGAGTLYGVGGWIDGTFGADVVLLLDGVVSDFGPTGSVYPNWTFLGAIDSAGFTTFEFQDIDGKGGQGVFIFGDDFTIGAAAVPEPGTLWLFGSSLLCVAIVRRRTR